MKYNVSIIISIKMHLLVCIYVQQLELLITAGEAEKHNDQLLATSVANKRDGPISRWRLQSMYYSVFTAISSPGNKFIASKTT